MNGAHGPLWEGRETTTEILTLRVSGGRGEFGSRAAGFLRPTHRDGAAMNGAHGLLWAGGEKQRRRF
jgi:hypothetical protein